MPNTYYAVIFSSIQPDHSAEVAAEYHSMAAQMETLAAEQPGYLGFESVREGNRSISISYWESETHIKAWKAQSEHLLAQQRGQDEWYRYYRVRVAIVERDYEFGSNP